MIEIYSGVTKIQSIQKVIKANIRETIDGELSLSFTVMAKSALSLMTGLLVKMDNQYYKIVQIAKNMQGGMPLCSVVCEHISYDLNNEEYTRNQFEFTGNAHAGLTALLDGTPFMAGIVEFTENLNIKINQKVSRRAALIQYISMIGGEIEYDAYTINIRKHRGSMTYKELMQSKNVTEISVTDDSRENTSSYGIAFFKLANLCVGDNVHIVFNPLGINVKTRIIALEYNPFYRYNINVEVGNFTPSISDTFCQMESTMDTVDYVFEEGKLNSETLKGLTIVNENNDSISFEVTEDGIVNIPGDAIVGGTLDANNVNIINFTADTGDVYYVIADNAKVTKLTVDHLLTMQIENEDDEINYIDIKNEVAKWIQGRRKYDEFSGEPLPDIQLADEDGQLLYWTDAEHNTMTKEILDSEGNFREPVMIHQYDFAAKMSFGFDDIALKNGLITKAPAIWIGSGTGDGLNGKACIYKDLDGIAYSYYNGTTGDLRKIDINDNGIEFIVENGVISGISEKLIVSKNDVSALNITVVPISRAMEVELGVDSHIYASISITGVSDINDILYIEILVDGTLYHKASKPIFIGENTLNIDYPLLQIRKGSHNIVARIYTGSSTFSVPVNQCLYWLKSDGILGGMSSKYPEANISQVFNALDIEVNPFSITMGTTTEEITNNTDTPVGISPNESFNNINLSFNSFTITCDSMTSTVDQGYSIVAAQVVLNETSFAEFSGTDEYMELTADGYKLVDFKEHSTTNQPCNNGKVFTGTLVDINDVQEIESIEIID